MYALTSEQCDYWYNVQQDRKSIPYQWIADNGVAIPRVKLPSGQYGWDLRAIAPFCELDFERGSEATLL